MRNPLKCNAVSILGTCLAVLLVSFFASAQDTGRVAFKVKPGTAGVFVDGKYWGPAKNHMSHRWVALTPGEHEITLSDPCCQDFTTKVNIEAGKSITLSQTLQPATPASPPFGTLRIEGGTSKFDAIYLNGKYMGHQDEFNNARQGLLINPGEYTLKVVSPGGSQLLEEKVKIEENKTTKIQVGSAG